MSADAPSRPRVLLLIDQKWRDLPGHVYLKRVLESEFGHRVVAGPFGCEGVIVPLFRPDAVVVNHLLESAKLSMVRRLREHGIAVIALPTEGMPCLEDVRLITAGKFTEMGQVDLQFCWNDEMRALVRDHGGLPEARIRVCGVPRFDVYREPARRLIAGRRRMLDRYALDPARPVVLFTTNFVNAGFVDANMAFMERNWRDLGLINVSVYRAPSENARKDHTTRRLALESLTRLLDDVREISVALKPHPNEDQRAYRAWIASVAPGHRGRVAVISQEYIWDTLGFTSVLIQRSCTTALEAWLHGLPTIEFQLNPEEYYFSADHARGSDIVRDYESLRERVRAYVAGAAAPEGQRRAREAILHAWMGPIDGRRTLACAAEIDRFVRGRPRARRVPLDPYWLRLGLRSAVKEVLYHPGRRLAARARALLATEPLDHLGRADKRVSFGDVRRWARRIDAAGALGPGGSTVIAARGPEVRADVDG